MPSGQATESDLVPRPGKLPYPASFLICLGFTIDGAIMIADGQWMGWFVAGFFGLGVVVLPILMLPGASYLRLAPDGFTVCSLYRRHGCGWAEVGPFSPSAVSGRKMVLFRFTDPAYRPRWRAVARVLAGAADGALPDTYGI